MTENADASLLLLREATMTEMVGPKEERAALLRLDSGCRATAKNEPAHDIRRMTSGARIIQGDSSYGFPI
jgi:hypothetical protein